MPISSSIQFQHVYYFKPYKLYRPFGRPSRGKKSKHIFQQEYSASDTSAPIVTLYSFVEEYGLLLGAPWQILELSSSSSC